MRKKSAIPQKYINLFLNQLHLHALIAKEHARTCENLADSFKDGTEMRDAATKEYIYANSFKLTAECIASGRIEFTELTSRKSKRRFKKCLPSKAK